MKRGEDPADYGKRIVTELANELLMAYGEYYSKCNLDYFCQFFRQFHDFEIWHSRVPNLFWTHFRQNLPVVGVDARYWYLREASRENWSARQQAAVCRQVHDFSPDGGGASPGDRATEGDFRGAT